MSRAGLAMLITLVVAAPAAAQPSLSMSVGPGVTSIGGENTGQFNAAASLEHLMKEERIRLFYELERGDYATAVDWRFLEHSAGGSYKFGFGKKKAHGLYPPADRRAGGVGEIQQRQAG